MEKTTWKGYIITPDEGKMFYKKGSGNLDGMVLPRYACSESNQEEIVNNLVELDESDALVIRNVLWTKKTNDALGDKAHYTYKESQANIEASLEKIGATIDDVDTSYFGYAFKYKNSAEVHISTEDWNLTGVASLESTFENAVNLQEIYLDGLDTSSITNMKNTFNGCSSIVTIGIATCDFSKVQNFNGTFSGCSSLNTISDVIDCSSVTDYTDMVKGCSSLIVFQLKNAGNKDVEATLDCSDLSAWRSDEAQYTFENLADRTGYENAFTIILNETMYSALTESGHIEAAVAKGFTVTTVANIEEGDEGDTEDFDIELDGTTEY